MNQAAAMSRHRQTSDLPERLGGALRAAYTRSQKTQARIAGELGTDPSQLQRYFTGKSEPPLSWIERFAAVTNSSTQTILGEAGIIEKLDLSACIDADPDLSDLARDLLKSALATARRHDPRGRDSLGRLLRQKSK